MKDLWSMRTRLGHGGDVRKLALFDLAIDSKSGGSDLVRLKVSDFVAGADIGPSQ
jgi:hypothetical protein